MKLEIRSPEMRTSVRRDIGQKLREAKRERDDDMNMVESLIRQVEEYTETLIKDKERDQIQG